MSQPAGGRQYLTGAFIRHYAYRDGNSVLSAPVDLGNDTQIGLVPDWMRQSKVIPEFGKAEVEDIQAARLALWTESGSATRSDLQSRGDSLRLANLALWIANPTHLSFEFVLESEGPSGTRSTCGPIRVQPLLTWEASNASSLSLLDMRKARSINMAIGQVPKSSPLWTGIRVSWAALTQAQELWDTRFLLLWVAIEALFGVEDRKKNITERRKARLAKFLAATENKGLCELKKMTDTSYGWRNKIAHGRIVNMEDSESIEVMRQTEWMLRNSLGGVLADESLIKTFAAADSLDKYLHKLTEFFRQLPAVSAL